MNSQLGAMILAIFMPALACGGDGSVGGAALVAPEIRSLTLSPSAFGKNEPTTVVMRVAFFEKNADLSKAYIEFSTDIPQVVVPPKLELNVAPFFVGQEEGIIPIELSVELPRVGAYNVSVLLQDRGGNLSAPATQTIEAK